MARILALAFWAITMLGMLVFTTWVARHKKQLEGLGVEISRPEMLVITIGDLLINYWYVPAVILLIACLAFSGPGKPQEK